jgi:HK97 gp10 family phage protein
MVIQVLGLDKCIAGFKDVSKIDMKPFIQRATALVQRTAKDMSPVDTGYLKRSIQRKTGKRGGEVVGAVSTTTEYAIYQEFGTSRMVAQPFMFPALDKNRKEIQQGAKKYVNANLKKFEK